MFLHFFLLLTSLFMTGGLSAAESSAVGASDAVALVGDGKRMSGHPAFAKMNALVEEHKSQMGEFTLHGERIQWATSKGLYELMDVLSWRSFESVLVEVAAPIHLVRTGFVEEAFAELSALIKCSVDASEIIPALPYYFVFCMYCQVPTPSSFGRLEVLWDEVLSVVCIEQARAPRLLDTIAVVTNESSNYAGTRLFFQACWRSGLIQKLYAEGAALDARAMRKRLIMYCERESFNRGHLVLSNERHYALFLQARAFYEYTEDHGPLMSLFKSFLMAKNFFDWRAHEEVAALMPSSLTREVRMFINPVESVGEHACPHPLFSRLNRLIYRAFSHLDHFRDPRLKKSLLLKADVPAFDRLMSDYVKQPNGQAAHSLAESRRPAVAFDTSDGAHKKRIMKDNVDEISGALGDVIRALGRAPIPQRMRCAPYLPYYFAACLFVYAAFSERPTLFLIKMITLLLSESMAQRDDERFLPAEEILAWALANHPELLNSGPHLAKEVEQVCAAGLVSRLCVGEALERGVDEQKSFFLRDDAPKCIVRGLWVLRFYAVAGDEGKTKEFLDWFVPVLKDKCKNTAIELELGILWQCLIQSLPVACRESCRHALMPPPLGLTLKDFLEKKSLTGACGDAHAFMRLISAATPDEIESLKLFLQRYIPRIRGADNLSSAWNTNHQALVAFGLQGLAAFHGIYLWQEFGGLVCCWIVRGEDMRTLMRAPLFRQFFDYDRRKSLESLRLAMERRVPASHAVHLWRAMRAARLISMESLCLPDSAAEAWLDLSLPEAREWFWLCQRIAQGHETVPFPSEGPESSLLLAEIYAAAFSKLVDAGLVKCTARECVGESIVSGYLLSECKKAQAFLVAQAKSAIASVADWDTPCAKAKSLKRLKMACWERFNRAVSRVETLRSLGAKNISDSVGMRISEYLGEEAPPSGFWHASTIASAGISAVVQCSDGCARADDVEDVPVASSSAEAGPSGAGAGRAHGAADLKRSAVDFEEEYAFDERDQKRPRPRGDDD